MNAAIVLLHPLVLSLASAPHPSAASDDWPQWRGPAHDNVSKEAGWGPASAEEPLWRAEA